MKIRRTYTYNFIKDDKVEMVLTSKQIYEKYGIRNIKKFLLMDPNPQIDGYLIVEGYADEDRFKKIDETEKYEYYISSMGYVLEVAKSDRKRKKLEIIIDTRNGDAYSQPDGSNRKYYIANLVVHKFLSKLPGEFKIIYLDGKPEHCQLENILVIPYRNNQ